MSHSVASQLNNNSSNNSTSNSEQRETSSPSSLSSKVLGGFKRKNSTTSESGGVMKKKFKTGSNYSACSTPPVSLSAADDPYSFDEEEKGNAANPMPSSAEFNRFDNNVVVLTFMVISVIT